jgi:hypothetical protein
MDDSLLIVDLNADHFHPPAALYFVGMRVRERLMSKRRTAIGGLVMANIGWMS